MQTNEKQSSIGDVAYPFPDISMKSAVALRHGQLQWEIRELIAHSWTFTSPSAYWMYAKIFPMKVVPSDRYQPWPERLRITISF